jgi:hypothetical protein
MELIVGETSRSRLLISALPRRRTILIVPPRRDENPGKEQSKRYPLSTPERLNLFPDAPIPAPNIRLHQYTELLKSLSRDLAPASPASKDTKKTKIFLPLCPLCLCGYESFPIYGLFWTAVVCIILPPRFLHFSLSAASAKASRSIHAIRSFSGTKPSLLPFRYT